MEQSGKESCMEWGHFPEVGKWRLESELFLINFAQENDKIEVKQICWDLSDGMQWKTEDRKWSDGHTTVH